MISAQLLQQYYELKCQEAELKNQLSALREEIISALKQAKMNACVLSDYSAELKYLHETTPQFIEFLKTTNNTHLIRETANCKAYEEMKNKYHFSDADEHLYYVLKAAPTLYVKKIKDK